MLDNDSGRMTGDAELIPMNEPGSNITSGLPTIQALSGDQTLSALLRQSVSFSL
jgi:hypothetical protein